MKEYSYTVLGLMSGTSLDGVDIAICSFREIKDKWEYDILYANTFVYDSEWKNRLKSAYSLGGRALIELDRVYGDYLAQIINFSITESNISPEIIASHGQTIFHSPEKRMTYQIGHGANIAIGTGLPVVCDFRSNDVALNGQGAPLVPIGDKLLFSNFESCLNLGGIANISFDFNNVRKAFDICPVNMALNELAGKLGLDYDNDGFNGGKGLVNYEMLKSLNKLNFYFEDTPKSLGYEWYERYFLPVLNEFNLTTYDKLATVYHHIAEQISAVVNNTKLNNVLVTGGGAHNKFLMETIASTLNAHIIVPDKIIIDYKEALIFAFLGLLRFHNRINTLASVTGATRDSAGGAIYMP